MSQATNPTSPRSNDHYKLVISKSPETTEARRQGEDFFEMHSFESDILSEHESVQIKTNKNVAMLDDRSVRGTVQPDNAFICVHLRHVRHLWLNTSSPCLCASVVAFPYVNADGPLLWRGVIL